MSELTLQGRDEIQIFSGEYWKKQVIDLRWYSDDKPTKKGIRMNLDEATKVHAILTRVLREAELNVEMD